MPLIMDLGMLGLFCVMAYRIPVATFRVSATFREFGLSTSLAIWALLFPLAPLILLVGQFWLPVYFTVVGAALCFIPAFTLAQGMGPALDRAGTDRVKPVREVVSQAMGTAIAGLVYVAVRFLYAVSVSFIS